MTLGKVGVVGASAGELSAIGALLAEAPATVVWSAPSGEGARARHAEGPADAILVVVRGSADRPSVRAAVELVGRRVLGLCPRDGSRLDAAYAAVEAGAADVASLPGREPEAPGDPDRLSTKVRRLLPPSSPSSSSSLAAAKRPSPAEGRAAPILAIGASTGGPQALWAVLAALPRDLEASIVLAQHMDEPFLAGLASWLCRASSREVILAGEGAELTPDRTLLVRSERQPVVDMAGRIRYLPLDPKTPFSPCIDTLFTSLASAPAASTTRGAAALLTGMGSDGARGLASLKRAGWFTVAQDEASSVVFGMPKAAAALGAASRVAPLDRVAPVLAEALSSRLPARPGA